MKICKNGHLQHISGIFDRKICISKIGLSQILDIAILHQYAKFHEKIYTGREIQEIPFFWRKIGCSGDF